MSDSEEFEEFEAYTDSDISDCNDTQDLRRSSPNFIVVTMAQVVNYQRELVQGVSETLGVPYDCCVELLNTNKWHQDLVISKFYDDPDYLSKLGLPDFKSISLNGVVVDMCVLCCEEDVPGYHLGCNHVVCADCLKGYIVCKIEERDPYELRCPGDPDCSFTVTEEIAKKLLDDYQFRTFLKLRAEMFIPSQRDKFCGCPTPDCKFYVEAIDPLMKLGEADRGTAYTDQMAVCNCTCSFCFLCGESHLPVACEVASAWLRLSNDASFIWIQSNTKSCPKCQSPIEKTHGCDHMSCRCGHHFCWACLGDFHNYQHKCSRLGITSNESDLKKQELLKTRLLHYAPRITSQLGHRRLHHEMLSKTRREIQSEDPLEEFYETLHTERGTVLDAHKVLAKARGLVAWTFVLMLFLKASNERTILENCTVDLQTAAETLGRLIIEKKLIPTKEDIKSKSIYVEQRHSVLLQYATTKNWDFEPYMREILTSNS